MKHYAISLLGAAGLLLLGAASAHAQTYQQVWADEFNGSISSSWKFETGGGGWGNNEKQYYQAANATVNATDLMITARKQTVGGMPYTSARMTTQGLKEFAYGKMEARIKLPIGQGLWPGFWMLGSNINSVSWPKCGEIDIMEHVNTDNKVYGTIHWDNNGHAQYGGNTTVTTADYHVYSIEWTPTLIKWLVDGTPYHQADISNGINSTEEFQRPFFLLLNLAVAGDWPGQTVDESKLPATMFVDYVRVYQLTNAPAPPTASSILLQAEAYNAMKGVQVENTSDTGGGQDVGYIDAGDYMVYNNVNFPTSGTYTIEYRVASPGGGTVSSDLNAGSIQLGNTTIPATGGWQTWRTISRTVNVNAGTYNFGVFAQTGGWNLNWVRITKSGTAARGTVAANAPAAPDGKALEVYPNPATERLQLRAAQGLTGSRYQILDAVGRLVSSGAGDAGSVDVSALRAGTYTLRLITKDQQRTSRQFSKQ